MEFLSQIRFFILGVIGEMLLHVLVLIIGVLETAKPRIALFKCVGPQRLEAGDENPLPDVEFPLAVQEERVLDILLDYFAVPQLHDAVVVVGDGNARASRHAGWLYDPHVLDSVVAEHLLRVAPHLQNLNYVEV
jgi:hypothetical protein